MILTIWSLKLLQVLTKMRKFSSPTQATLLYHILIITLGPLIGHLIISLRIDLIGSATENEKPLFLHYSNSYTSVSSVNEEQFFAVAAFLSTKYVGLLAGDRWKSLACALAPTSRSCLLVPFDCRQKFFHTPRSQLHCASRHSPN